MTALLAEAALLLVRLADEVPEPEDVKAGWTAFALFLGLIVVVGLLGWSLSKHLRTAQRNEEAGMFGSDDDSASTTPSPEASQEAEPHQAP